MFLLLVSEYIGFSGYSKSDCEKLSMSIDVASYYAYMHIVYN